MKARKPAEAKKLTSPSAKRLAFPNDEPVKINILFEDTIKKALNNPIKPIKKK